MGISTVKICGAAFVSVIALLVIKQVKSDFAPALRIGATVLLCGIVLGMAAPVVKFLSGNLSDSAIAGYGKIIMKALGVAYLTQICAQVCRDSGEPTVAADVETAGKTELLLLALPLFEEVFAAVREILSWH